MDTTESRRFAARLADLLRNEQHAMADFLVALAEFDQRRGWIELGYANLFDFLVRDVGLSRGTAHYRKTAAHLVQRYPEVLDALREGSLCITSIVELSKVITPENCDAVLPRFLHRSKQEAKAISAELAPRPVVARREVVTSARCAAQAAPTEALCPAVSASAPAANLVPPVQPVELVLQGSAPASAGQTPALARLSVEPLTATERRLHITVSPKFLEKLKDARLALSHSMPGASAEEVLSAGLDLLLERDAKRKGLVAKPRPAPANAPAEPGGDHVPAVVRREVWTRDEGCCQWKLDSGGVCGSRLRVELDHVKVKSLGGRPLASELRLLCDMHNQLYAREVFGDAFMDRYTQNPRRPEQLGLTTVP